MKYFCPPHKIFTIFSLTALLSFVFYQRTLLLLHFPIDSLVWDMEIEIKFTMCNWDHEMFLQLKFKKQDVLQPKKILGSHLYSQVIIGYSHLGRIRKLVRNYIFVNNLHRFQRFTKRFSRNCSFKKKII